MTATRRPDNYRPRQANRHPDDVVLLDEVGAPVGHADRQAVHTSATPLHLAFSTYLFNARGEVLVTRRALGKKTWPGVWTNSCCGHPQPGEAIEDAARRRIREELGLHVGPLTPLLPDFRYRAVDASGIVENEICPVFAGHIADEQPIPNPDEVAEWAWVPWENLVTAIAATPHVYSPWAALQVPQVAALRSHASSARPSVDVESAIRDVDDLLTAELHSLASEWEGLAGALGVDVLPADLPQWLATLVVGRGKRFRVRMAYWGYLAAGGRHGAAGYSDLIRVAAALEVLHLFALVHDDVMDESESRRGGPSAHVEAGAWHRASGASGDPGVFGRNLAILLGDLAHLVADRLADGLPPRLRSAWYALLVELIAGQRADLTGSAAGRRDRDHAEQVARLKSGSYSVTRPLELGATAAAASPAAIACLTAYGDQLGQAFALRDDHLGVWGDPRVTGKPAGDDLVEAKATVLLSLARERLRGPDAELLALVGTAAFGPDDAPVLAAAMRAAGVEAELEGLISECVDVALAALDERHLAPDALSGLREAARALAWRVA